MKHNTIDFVLKAVSGLLGFACVVLCVALAVVNVGHIPKFDDGGHIVPDNPPIDDKTSFNVLIVGTDVASNSSDVMMIANIDKKEGTLKILQIPRDTYVNGVASGYDGITKLNAVYAREYSKNKSLGYSNNNAKKRSMEALCTFFNKSFGINIDDYILVNVSCFRSIVDAVGGIWFDVPYDMKYEDPFQNLYIDLKAGYQLLDGDKAEQLIRFRESIKADLGRIEVRAKFLKAMAVQTKENMTLGALLSITPSLLSNMITSVGVSSAIDYVKLVYGLNLDDVEIKTVTGNIVWDESRQIWTSEYYLNRFAAVRDINEILVSGEDKITTEDFDKFGYFLNESNPNAVDYYTREDL
ncbi:MAG: LCP family protein [Clostridia bacterium]|nr:LCP family protein [Clostridia bacterium]